MERVCYAKKEEEIPHHHDHLEEIHVKVEPIHDVKSNENLSWKELLLQVEPIDNETSNKNLDENLVQVENLVINENLDIKSNKNLDEKSATKNLVEEEIFVIKENPKLEQKSKMRNKLTLKKKLQLSQKPKKFVSKRQMLDDARKKSKMTNSTSNTQNVDLLDKVEILTEVPNDAEMTLNGQNGKNSENSLNDPKILKNDAELTEKEALNVKKSKNSLNEASNDAKLTGRETLNAKKSKNSLNAPPKPIPKPQLSLVTIIYMISIIFPSVFLLRSLVRNSPATNDCEIPAYYQVMASRSITLAQFNKSVEDNEVNFMECHTYNFFEYQSLKFELDYDEELIITNGTGLVLDEEHAFEYNDLEPFENNCFFIVDKKESVKYLDKKDLANMMELCEQADCQSHSLMYHNRGERDITIHLW